MHLYYSGRIFALYTHITGRHALISKWYFRFLNPDQYLNFCLFMDINQFPQITTQRLSGEQTNSTYHNFESDLQAGMRCSETYLRPLILWPGYPSYCLPQSPAAVFPVNRLWRFNGPFWFIFNVNYTVSYSVALLVQVLVTLLSGIYQTYQSVLPSQRWM